MILSMLALSALIWQLPMSAALSQPANVRRAEITVTAEDDGSGAPIGGVAITLTVVSSDSRRVTFTGTTFADGKAEFPNLPPGRYIVTASSSELLAAPPLGIGDPQRSIRLKPGAQEVVAFSFSRPAAIQGQVLTPTGRPVQSATVEVVMTKSEIRGRPVVEAGPGSSTDAEGRFRIEKLVPGRYLVRARLPALVDTPLNFIYAPGTTVTTQATPVILSAGADIPIGITALAVPAVTVGGRVVNAAGEPVPNAIVTLTSVDEREIPGGYVGPRWPYVSAGISPPESVRTDGAGRFVVSGVRDGLYALQAVVRGTGSPTPVVAAGVAEVEVGSSTIDSLTIKLLPCARITGRFLFNGLETTDPGRSVVEMRPDGEDAYLRKGHTRRFSVKRILPGHMYLVALHPSFEAPDSRAASQDLLETLNELWPRATRIFIGEAGKFEVTLAPLPRAH